MYHEIEVTQADIDEGINESARNCAITRAAMRSGLFDKAPLLATCRDYEDDKPYIYITPDSYHDTTESRVRIEADIDVDEWVDEFDGGYLVQPFSFKINLE